MSISLIDGIACVLDAFDRPIGTGFVVSNDGLIANCAQIISEPCPESVMLVFQASEERREARILLGHWRSENAEDVGILQLIGNLATGVKPIPLVLLR